MTHYDIFRDQLAIKYHAFGHALWEPDPGGQYPPAEVGDVGFIREGKFHRLFNALLMAGHPSHGRFGVPEYHEPLQPTVPNHIDRGTLNPNNFCSYGVTDVSGRSNVFAVEPPASSEVSFTCSKKPGAVLALPVTARREDTLARGDFAKWMIRHIDTWFAFARRLGLGIDQMEDLILVTGRHRTRSWSNIAFDESQTDAQVSFRVQVTGSPGAGVSWQVSSRNIQGAVLSHGPSGENLPEDQCIFVRGFRMKRTFKIFPRLRGAAGFAPDSSWDDDKPEMEVVSVLSSNITDTDREYRDPLHVLLESIAERTPNCDLALVHDDDLERILRVGDGVSLESLQPEGMVDYLKRSELEIGVMSCHFPANDKSPRTDTEQMRVAMLSEQALSFSHQELPLMVSGGSFPHHQHNYVSSTVVDPDSAILPNAPTDRHGVNATAEHGSYLVRTGSALNGPSTCDSLDYPDWFSSPETYIGQGQDLSNATRAPLTAPVLAQGEFAAPRAQKWDIHTPSQVTTSTPETLDAVQSHQVPTTEIEALRKRLAFQYLNNPKALVTKIRVEPGPSGRIQVEIVLEFDSPHEFFDPVVYGNTTARSEAETGQRPRFSYDCR